MDREDVTLFARAIGIGIVAGMRSMLAPALVSLAASRPGLLPEAEEAPFDTFGMTEVAAGLSVLALGELVVDKLPIAPARTIPPSVAWRALSGALAGATVCGRRNRALGAFLGATAAVGATYVAYHLRREAGRRLEVPDLVLALAEDAIAIGTGVGILNT